MAIERRNAVLAAVDRQEAATAALRTTLSPERDILLENLLDAAEDRVIAIRTELVEGLAELLPGVGPAIRELAEVMISRTQI